MKSLGEFLQSGDWKGEKHVPVIEVPEEIKANEVFELKLGVGEAIGHPNTLEHHIAWMKLFFVAEDSKFPVELADLQFRAHGENDIFDEPFATIKAKLPKAGTLYAVSYCNIHGLWENSLEVKF